MVHQPDVQTVAGQERRYAVQQLIFLLWLLTLVFFKGNSALNQKGHKTMLYLFLWVKASNHAAHVTTAKPVISHPPVTSLIRWLEVNLKGIYGSWKVLKSIEFSFINQKKAIAGVKKSYRIILVYFTWCISQVINQNYPLNFVYKSLKYLLFPAVDSNITY